jgi:tetratricopeptide (TPR) repeat protein
VKCPSCGKRVPSTAWICRSCDHILDPSVLEQQAAKAEEETTDERVPSVREERTALIAWNPKPEPYEEEPLPDAVILGSGDGGGSRVVRGAGATNDGKTSTFLFYTSAATSRVVHPDSIPVIADTDHTIPRTPYEDFILSQVDGRRSVRQIHRSSGLAPQEVVVTLLTLLDKGAVRMEKPGATKSGARPQPEDDFELDEATQAFPPKEPSVGELPSASDFDQLIEEVQEEIRAKEPISQSRPIAKRPPPLPPRSGSDSDDVWARDDDSAQSAEVIAEDEAELLTSEEVTKASLAPLPPRGKVPVDRKDTKPPARSTSFDATLPPPSENGDVPTREDPPRARGSDVSWGPLGAEPGEPFGPPLRRIDTVPPTVRRETPAPVLDPAFLVEVPPSNVAKAPIDPSEQDVRPKIAPLRRPGSSARRRKDDAKAKQRAALEAAMKRGPIQERHRRLEEQPKKKRGRAAEAMDAKAEEKRAEEKREEKRAEEKREEKRAGKAEGEPAAVRRESRPKAEPVDAATVLKAQKLFEQALKDKAEGNLVSARMNMKLAMTFDPANELYADSFDELNKNPDAQVKSSGPTGKSRARELYDQATEAENGGDVDRAVILLEQAIAHSKQPPFLNRLGVILAMKKKEFVRAQQLVEQAIDLAPDNATYQRNLQKILSMAATADVAAGDERDKKGGLLGFLGRKK